MQFPGAWMQVPAPPAEQVISESAARAGRQHKGKEYDNMATSRTSAGHKPNQLHVKPVGYVDHGSDTKNAWDDAIRSLVPLLLDMSVIEWEG
jgi:hypothetical protein